MVPAGVVDATLNDLTPHLEADDIIIDGGNSYYVDDIRRAKQLKEKQLHYVDCGTSGGVFGLDRGYLPDDRWRRQAGGVPGDPIFKTLAPGIGSVERTQGARGCSAEDDG